MICCIGFINAVFGQRHQNVNVCEGSTYTWDISYFCDSLDTVIYANGPEDWTVFYTDIHYDTAVGNTITLHPTESRLYRILSINGVALDCPILLSLHVKKTPKFVIDSVKHVTCPDGEFYSYHDGEFFWHLTDSIWEYDGWTGAFPVGGGAGVDDSIGIYYHAYGQWSGTYHLIAYGTNGCEYHDSVTIEQPEAWHEDLEYRRIDTVCYGQPGCISIGYCGGTSPYSYTWFHYSDTGLVLMPDTTRLACDLYSGHFYILYMYDSRGCKFFGEEIDYILCYLYEYVEDSTHIITTDNIACYGREFMVQAQSIGEGNYTWHVGDQSDSINYWTSIYGDSMFVADYITPPITEPTWVYAEFSDQHNCVTRDSIWVEVYNSNISLTIETPNIVTDSTCTVQVFPPGGNLFVDGVVVGYSIPSEYTFSTDGISVGPHTLRYAGTFGAEVGVGCDDETSQTIQVETNPFVPDWEYEISIYPNPATTTLNLSSTGTSDFELSVLDITGKVIKTEKMLDQTFTFDVSDLASGIYMLRLVSTDGASKVVKFVKR